MAVHAHMSEYRTACTAQPRRTTYMWNALCCGTWPFALMYSRWNEHPGHLIWKSFGLLFSCHTIVSGQQPSSLKFPIMRTACPIGRPSRPCIPGSAMSPACSLQRNTPRGVRNHQPDWHVPHSPHAAARSSHWRQPWVHGRRFGTGDLY
jgi:hypothetical protein